MTRISFIMPSFNRGRYIAESIRSITSQMGPDDELVVVDDGSTDDTGKVVQALDAPLRYIRQDNAGKSVALNRAMSVTDGHYVWICDDDDLLLPGVVAEMIALIEASGAGMVFGRYTRFRMDGAQKLDMGVGYWPDLSKGALARHILEDAFVMHNAALVRRDAYRRAGPFDPAMLRSQDYEMFVRLALETPVLFHDRLIFEQRKHDGARGPQSITHAAGSSDAVWEKFDRMIFEKVRSHVPLSFFESMVSGDDERLAHRAALLQRGCIMGRHGLWTAAFDDLARAVAVAPHLPLHGMEQDICRRVVMGKHGFAGLLKPAILALMEQLRIGSPAGRQITVSMADGMVWQLRGEDPLARKNARAFLSQGGGLRYGLPVILARLRGQSGTTAAEARENDQPRHIDAATAGKLAPLS